jgi:hypothetical protein
MTTLLTNEQSFASARSFSSVRLRSFIRLSRTPARVRITPVIQQHRCVRAVAVFCRLMVIGRQRSVWPRHLAPRTKAALSQHQLKKRAIASMNCSASAIAAFEVGHEMPGCTVANCSPSRTIGFRSARWKRACQNPRPPSNVSILN